MVSEQGKKSRGEKLAESLYEEGGKKNIGKSIKSSKVGSQSDVRGKVAC